MPPRPMPAQRQHPPSAHRAAAPRRRGAPARWLMGVALGLLLAAVSRPVPADPPPPEPLLLVTSEFPPCNYEEDGEQKGICLELVREVFARLGQPITIQFLAAKRAMRLAAQGRAAGYFTYTINPERQRVVHFTRPLTTIADVFFKRRDRAITWTTLADLAPYRVGYTEGYNYAPVFLQAVAQKTFRLAPLTSRTPELHHLRKLALGRMDLAICERSLCTHLIRQHPGELGALDHIPRTIGPARTFHLGFSRRLPGGRALRDRFDAVLAELLAEGRVTAIHQRYGVTPDLALLRDGHPATEPVPPPPPAVPATAATPRP